MSLVVSQRAIVLSDDILLAFRIGFQNRATILRLCVGEGQDRSAARATLGGEFPALALSIGEVGA